MRDLKKIVDGSNGTNKKMKIFELRNENLKRIEIGFKDFQWDPKIAIPEYSDDILSKRFPKEFIRTKIDDDNILYCNYLNFLQKSRDKQMLVLNDLEKLGIENINTEENKKYLYQVISLYTFTCLFPNERTIGFFKTIGFCSDSLIWFHDLNTITKEFEKILDRKKIVFFKGEMLMCIFNYLAARINNEVLFVAGEYIENYNNEIYLNTDYFKAKKKLKKFPEVILEIKKAAKLLHFEIHGNDMDSGIKSIESITEEESIPVLIKMYKGNPIKEVLSQPVMHSFYATNFQSENIFFGEFFDLFKPLIGNRSKYCPFYELYSEEEYASYPRYLHKSYTTYKGKRISDIIMRNNSYWVV